MEKEGAVRHDEQRELRRKAVEVAKKYSPDLNNLQRVVIDRNTSIYVSKDKDPEIAKAKFIEKMRATEFDIRYKNYDVSAMISDE